jgi:hypothetical protein
VRRRRGLAPPPAVRRGGSWVPGLAVARGFAPCFPVRDMRAALARYEQLGFEVMPYTEEVTWAWARLGAAELHLFVKDNHDLIEP